MILRHDHGTGPQAWKRKLTKEQAREMVRQRVMRRRRPTDTADSK